MDSLSYILRNMKKIADNVSDDVINTSGDTEITTTMDLTWDEQLQNLQYHIVPKQMFKAMSQQTVDK